MYITYIVAQHTYMHKAKAIVLKNVNIPAERLQCAVRAVKHVTLLRCVFTRKRLIFARNQK